MIDTHDGPDCAPDCKPPQTVPGEPAPIQADPSESRTVALTSPERHPVFSTCVKAWGRRLFPTNAMGIKGLRLADPIAITGADCAPDCKSPQADPSPAKGGGAHA